MKKILLLSLLFTTPAFAYYIENIPNACATINNDKIAVFQTNTYTCANGYFLPANTAGCQPCPNGYTCGGGSFVFNETLAQGLENNAPTNQNISKACSRNETIRNKVAVFTPNVINLNWYLDENATTPMSVPTASQQCTYDTKIVLPPEPTRPGYIFSGWRLRKNN